MIEWLLTILLAIPLIIVGIAIICIRAKKQAKKNSFNCERYRKDK
jgi:prolipoprotein diacylglyceryltransferase